MRELELHVGSMIVQAVVAKMFVWGKYAKQKCFAYKSGLFIRCGRPKMVMATSVRCIFLDEAMFCACTFQAMIVTKKNI